MQRICTLNQTSSGIFLSTILLSGLKRRQKIYTLVVAEKNCSSFCPLRFEGFIPFVLDPPGLQHNLLSYSDLKLSVSYRADCSLGSQTSCSGYPKASPCFLRPCWYFHASFWVTFKALQKSITRQCSIVLS